ncbi:DUF5071 domain-containing protein [Sedimentibacter sp. zth1]|uniref:DUF5071 domain-containing protein n=1 Tax=Sedimentibacter sp. zth1 TaxID=2816908 RepID=UPI001A927418|nr:DUF5071 domain-containing protein [Sedimentibacter sp. zth1]QSX06702.1 DUF5071 domain-containing protein [Sedimentibacter sp. zth1]
MDWITIIDRLNWNNDEDDIAAAKVELGKISDESLHLLVQPLSKFHWENSAEVIVNIGVNKCIPIISELLKWLQDMNWPGAIKIYNMLKESESTIVDNYIKKSAEDAKKEDDEEWLENINMLIEERNIK